jgi:four helix bundle protein
MADSPITSFRDLEVWQVSMDLVDRVLEETKKLPRSEFDLRRQMRRAVISIPSNVAEGYKRKKKRPAYQNHVSIVMGSQGELETHVLVCQRNNLMPNDSCKVVLVLTDRVGAMLYRLHESLN